MFRFLSLEGESALAGGVGQGFHPAMILVAAAIEGDFLDALGNRALGDQLADRLGRLDVGGGLQAGLQALVDRRGRSDRGARGVVDDLRRCVEPRVEQRRARTDSGMAYGWSESAMNGK